jgi:hypothetical protein
MEAKLRRQVSFKQLMYAKYTFMATAFIYMIVLIGTPRIVYQWWWYTVLSAVRDLGSPDLALPYGSSKYWQSVANQNCDIFYHRGESSVGSQVAPFLGAHMATLLPTICLAWRWRSLTKRRTS